MSRLGKLKREAINEANKRVLGEQTVSFDGQGNYSYYDTQGNPTDEQGNPLSSSNTVGGDGIKLELDKSVVIVGAALLGVLVGKTIHTLKNKKELKDILTTIDNTIDKKTRKCLTRKLNWISPLGLKNLNNSNITSKTDKILEACLIESGKDIEEFKTEFHNSIKTYNLKG
mgnify:CR=1 FL=1